MNNFKNPQILLKNATITFAMISTPDTGFRGQGKKLTFNANACVKENKEAIDKIVHEYNSKNKRALREVFKELLIQVKQMYRDNELTLNSRIAERFNVDIQKLKELSWSGEYREIVEAVVNDKLLDFQKRMKFPFNFEVEVAESESYEEIPKLSVSRINMKLRQQADYKSLALFDASPNQLITMKETRRIRVIADSVEFPRANKEKGYVEYGKKYDNFCDIYDYAVCDVNCSLYFNAKSGTMTLYPNIIVIRDDNAVDTSIGDDIDLSMLGFDESKKDEIITVFDSAETEDINKIEEIDFDDDEDCPF